MKTLISISIIVAFVMAAVFFTGCYSCKSYHEWKGTGPVDPAVAEKAYWDKDCQPYYVAKKPETAKPKPAKKPSKASECGPYQIARSYPCSACGIIQLNKTMPKQVMLNNQFNYSIKVTNLADITVNNIVITEKLPENFQFSSADPSAKKEDNTLTWTIDSLESKASKLLNVVGIATDTKCVTTCAKVTYDIHTCANVIVVQPELLLTKSAPAETLLCDPIPIKLVVKNLGTGTARKVEIVDSLPTGLKTAEGKAKITINAGDLTAGQSKEYTVKLKASKTGKYVNKATASATGGLKSETAPTTTIVRQPILAITKTGPANRYLGRPVTYIISLSNKGDATAENVILEDTIPAGMTFVSANHLGAAREGKVYWNLPKLPPEKNQLVEVTYTTDREGTFSDRATAKADCATPVTASAKTTFTGIAAILMEVIDVEDPIELGSHETYIITATNQGTTADTNISIVCTLEDNVEYYSSSGTTTATVKDNVVTFKPLPSLAPKAKATWKVVVKAVKVGDVRFKVTMNSDQLSRPVEETEATEMYE